VAQLTLQEPGPRGSPQVPQGAMELAGRLEAEEAPTAKTEKSCSSSVLWQAGQAAGLLRLTSFSKRWPQSKQRYSKIGIP
jgi:hypothetical protein